jgi:hypothetical protein
VKHQALSVTRFEVTAKDIRICDVCDYGPLAWVRNRNGKAVLAMVYSESGKLIANSEHVHLPRACQTKLDDVAMKQQTLEPHEVETSHQP